MFETGREAGPTVDLFRGAAARADGIGMGWVSILDPVAVTRVLDVPSVWSLVAYLCLGVPAEEHLDPELERHHWESRTNAQAVTFTR